jgi:hypothetical protein
VLISWLLRSDFNTTHLDTAHFPLLVDALFQPVSHDRGKAHDDLQSNEQPQQDEAGSGLHAAAREIRGGGQLLAIGSGHVGTLHGLPLAGPGMNGLGDGEADGRVRRRKIDGERDTHNGRDQAAHGDHRGDGIEELGSWPRLSVGR